MVESIFDGKSFHVFNEPFIPFTVEGKRRRSCVERFSTSPSGLQTISENEDYLRGSTSALCDDTNAEAPIPGRQVRAVSLPSIYRDGSYLRMHFPAKFTKGKVRRFSEPAVSLTALKPSLGFCPILENDAEDLSTESQGNKSDPATAVKVRSLDLSQRRHSDPLLYTSKLNSLIKNAPIADASGKAADKDNNAISFLPIDDNGGTAESQFRKVKPEKPIPRKQPATSVNVRKRKSSLVPIPFGVAQGQKNKPTVTKNRPLSFPPSKKEETTRKNYRDLEFDSEGNFESSLDKNIAFTENRFIPIEIDVGFPSEANDVVPKYSCENIITQWMKFFG
ncbi:uncharacterized protein LOC116601633 [Nematostella vectensis]|uniref:uncharacterized protein LOC116601633 n=1 Tax=Nematostella vectensis TaxID=45351 RepID=UPI00207786E3|nr:uncharacterized protein LOC116601633 [Nematostella vectensis]